MPAGRKLRPFLFPAVVQYPVRAIDPCIYTDAVAVGILQIGQRTRELCLIMCTMCCNGADGPITQTDLAV